MMLRLMFVVLALVAVTVLAIPVAATDVSLSTFETPDGVTVTESHLGDGTTAAPEFDMRPLPRTLEGDSVLWHRNLADAIYTSTGISESARLVFAGTQLNPPRHVEATPLGGGGTPDWTYGGTEFYVDASRSGEVLAAVDYDNTDSTATIMEWRHDSSTPLWSYDVHPCRSLIYQGWASRKPIRVSDDGLTIAIGMTMYTPSGLMGRLYLFDAGSGTPAVVYDLPTGSVSAVEITPQGEFIAMASWPTVYVYDRYGETLRWSGAIGAGNDALAISGGGRYLAWGWSTFYLREWNGSTYQHVWSFDPPGTYYVGQCALSPDESALAIAWDNGNQTPNEIWLELYELPSLALLWEYTYVPSPADCASLGISRGGDPLLASVDMPSQMLFCPYGERLAIASWGGTFPEIHVFERSSPTPLFTLDTPGSMFDVDVVTSVQGTTYVTACGKHVHAGQSGRGGDLYAIAIPGAAASAPEGPITARPLELGPNHPNPFSSQTAIRYALPAQGSVSLTVYDVQGRFVAKLVDGIEEAGCRLALWTGRDDHGVRVPSGVYIARLESRGQVRTQKVVMLE